MYLDFVRLYTKEAKNSSKNRESGSLDLCLDFQVFNTKDLMTRGKDFYAIYDDSKGKWMKDEMSVVNLVDSNKY